jgi:hypothetical protein
MTTMTTMTEALEKDRKVGFYVEFDEGYSDYGVFGADTGYCYLLSGEDACKKKSSELNKLHTDCYFEEGRKK